MTGTFKGSRSIEKHQSKKSTENGILQNAHDQTGLNKNMYKQNAVSNVTD